MPKRILVVGHCDVDGPRLVKEVSAQCRGAEVLRVNSDGALRKQCEQGADLLLVNREPVGFNGMGVDIVKTVRAEHPDQKVMLVSDRPEAQEEAVAAGALPGFGKGDLGSPKFSQTLEKALA